MKTQKKYWKGLEELHNDPEFVENAGKEFAEYVPVDEFVSDKQTLENSATSRRDFLKFLGFSVTAASLAACETPITKAIPYLNKPEEITPGVANYYASTYFDGNDYASILVKTREGRPIKIEGNKLSNISQGGVNARINASVLALYDNNRLKNPLKGGNKSSFDEVDKEITSKLKDIAAKGGQVRLITHSIISPSTKQVIEEFGNAFGAPEGNFKHIQYDAVSYSAMLTANKKSFGKQVLPSYRFDKAKVIVSVAADFLANWISPIQYAADYAKTRKPENDWMSKHYQIEANMSLTGSNADVRVPVKPSEYGAFLVALANEVAAKTGGEKLPSAKSAYEKSIKKIAHDLLAAKGHSLVVCGVNDENLQLIVNKINDDLGNYQNTIDLTKPVYLKQSTVAGVEKLVQELESGKVDAVLIQGVNPVFTLPVKLAKAFKSGLAKAKLSVSFATYNDETAQACQYVCPDNHYLESWNDAMPVLGELSFTQPTISPLFNTRQFQESLMAWAGMSGTYHDYIQKYWENNLFSTQTESVFFNDFWNKKLHDGVYSYEATEVKNAEISREEAENLEEEANLTADYAAAAKKAVAVKGGTWELELYSATAIGDGTLANNPWLQELPDPVTKITWDNYITMNPEDAKEQGYNIYYGQEKPATLASVAVNGVTIDKIPVIALPGQKRGTIGIALGYGKRVGAMDEPTGVNAYPLLTENLNTLQLNVEITNLDEEYPVAATQTHHTFMGRESIIKETDLATYKTGDKHHFNHTHTFTMGHEQVSLKEADLYKPFPIEEVGHRWGMVIDLNACIGCGACVTSCIAENNIPVVGKDEVRRSREMHWLRIDRYFSSIEEEASKPLEERDNFVMDIPESENPSVVFQPVMCQHCNHAPCENVCPVAATSHSLEGLNMMAYNRCIGTRYCANNCPYKVRRFNWFNYQGNTKFTDTNPAQDDLGRMVLNPDVVVRARGVIEKCSMCVQRIQEGKLNAKKESRKVRDGEIQTACASVCPTNAITFGDVNDKETQVRKAAESDRSYHVLEEIGTQPNVWYQVKVRNIESNHSNNHHEA